MFYKYMNYLNSFCNIFGLSMPYITTEGKSVPTNPLIKLWCLVIVALFTASFCFFIKITEFKLKAYLEIISDINDLVANIIIMLVNIFNNGKNNIDIHKTFNIIFQDINFEYRVIKIFAIKIYFWFSIPTIIFGILVTAEIFHKNPPYDLLIRTPEFLSMVHLFMHLYIILALLKVVNSKLYKNFMCGNEHQHKDQSSRVENITKYVLNPAIKFIEYNDEVYFGTNVLCKIYDNLSTSILLLERCHGLQMLITIWLMFTRGVVGMTLVVCDQTSIQWLVLVKSIFPYAVCLIGCYIQEQLRTEVDQTSTLILKCIINYRCVPTLKKDLETFKELISNNRLQFSACNLFHLDYAMLLGAILNVITYSIIMIQMFLN